MVGVDYEKNVQVLSIEEHNGKKRARYMYGTPRTGYSFGMAEIRSFNGEEYFLCHRRRIFLSDLWRKVV